MLTDYLVTPSGSADAGAGAEFPFKFQPARISKPTVKGTRLPGIRPSVSQEDLLALLRMQEELVERVEREAPDRWKDRHTMDELIAETTKALPDTLVQTVRNVYYAQMFARTQFQNGAPWAGPHHLSILNPDYHLWQIAHGNYRYCGLIPAGSIPEPPYGSRKQEQAIRYLISTAATVHGGMVWALDFLKTYAFQQIQGALLVCAAPCRPDWHSGRFAEVVSDYGKGEWAEAHVFRARAVTHRQLLTLYDRPRVTQNLIELATHAWFSATDEGLRPAASGYGSLYRMLHHTVFAPDLHSQVIALYLLTFLLPLLRDIAVDRLRAQAWRKPVTESRRFVLRNFGQFLDQKDITHRAYLRQPGQSALFPAEMEAMSFARQANRLLPYFVIKDNDNGFLWLLVPGLEQTAARLRRMYGMPEPELLIALPAGLERLTAVERPDFGGHLEARLGALYQGLRDVRPVFVEHAEPRSAQECPPEDLFHCFLLEESV